MALGQSLERSHCILPGSTTKRSGIALCVTWIHLEQVCVITRNSKGDGDSVGKIWLHYGYIMLHSFPEQRNSSETHQKSVAKCVEILGRDLHTERHHLHLCTGKARDLEVSWQNHERKIDKA